jgi:hypothetical protein
MRVITMQYNPLDCTCWAYGPLEYCEYCNPVCDAALEDFECELEDRFFIGQDGESPPPCPHGMLMGTFVVGDRDADPAELQAFFEEASVPSPGLSASRASVQVSRIRGETLRRPPRSAGCPWRGAWLPVVTLH